MKKQGETQSLLSAIGIGNWKLEREMEMEMEMERAIIPIIMMARIL